MRGYFLRWQLTERADRSSDLHIAEKQANVNVGGFFAAFSRHHAVASRALQELCIQGHDGIASPLGERPSQLAGVIKIAGGGSVERNRPLAGDDLQERWTERTKRFDGIRRIRRGRFPCSPWVRFLGDLSRSRQWRRPWDP